jgi:hypothetical protein
MDDKIRIYTKAIIGVVVILGGLIGGLFSFVRPYEQKVRTLTVCLMGASNSYTKALGGLDALTQVPDSPEKSAALAKLIPDLYITKNIEACIAPVEGIKYPTAPAAAVSSSATRGEATEGEVY